MVTLAIMIRFQGWHAEESFLFTVSTIFYLIQFSATYKGNKLDVIYNTILTCMHVFGGAYMMHDADLKSTLQASKLNFINKPVPVITDYGQRPWLSMQF